MSYYPKLAYFVVPNPGFLRFGDADRVSFLQRQSTNDLRMLAPGRSVTTVLTTPTARILDVLTLFEEGSTLGGITLPGFGQATYDFLRRRIFFNDKVKLENASADYAQIRVEGSGVGEWLASLGDAALFEGDFWAGSIGGIDVRVVGEPGLAGVGLRVLLPMGDLDKLLAHLADSGAASLSLEDFETARIEVGLPGAGTELTEDYTPMEVGLLGLISQTKGCYTGQEIIARQITYDKVTRQLVGLRMAGKVGIGAPIQVAGKSVGQITSSAVSPRFGAIALAVVKHLHDDIGTEVVVAANEREVRGEVVELPLG